MIRQLLATCLQAGGLRLRKTNLGCRPCCREGKLYHPVAPRGWSCFPGPTHLVVGFEHQTDAERFLQEFQERLAKFGLMVHPEKTRLIKFGKYARRRRQKRGEGEPETFTFLGFTHECAVARTGGFKLKRTTVRKRLEAKLQEVKQSLRQRMHDTVATTGGWLRQMLTGYYQYHAIPGNLAALKRFRERIQQHWRRSLRRRSQGRAPNEAKLARLFARWVPRPQTLHPYPGVRFDARYPR